MCSGTPRCPVKIPGKLEKSSGNTWNIPGKWKSKFAGHPDNVLMCIIVKLKIIRITTTGCLWAN